MIRSYTIFDDNGVAVVRPGLTRQVPDIFEQDRTIKRVEVYQRREDQSIWDKEYVKTFYAKDFKLEKTNG